MNIRKYRTIITFDATSIDILANTDLVLKIYLVLIYKCIQTC